MVRVRYEEFGTLAGLFRFDGEGYITATPDMQAVRGALEAGWRASPALTGIRPASG